MAAPVIPYTIPGTVGEVNPWAEIIVRLAFDGAQVDEPTYGLGWVDVSDRLRSFQIDRGGENELDAVDTGTCTVVLDNRDRELDPFNTASSYSPNVLPRRRLWILGQWDGDTHELFYGWTGAWQPSWPTVNDSVVTVSAQDGLEALGADALPVTNPPSESYGDVVAYDQPWGYWPLGEPEGTKVVSHVRIKRKRHKKNKKHKKAWWTKKKIRWTTIETASDVEGVSGPTGTYENTPLLDQAGAIVGDDDPAVYFNNAGSEYVKIIVCEVQAAADGGSATGCKELSDQNRLTMECWVKFTSLLGAVQVLLCGPALSAGAAPSFRLGLTAGNLWSSTFLFTDGSSSTASGGTPVVGTWYHVASTWDGTTTTVYVNGSSVATNTPAAGKQMRAAGNLNGDRPWVMIGHSNEVGFGEYINATVQHAAIYEKALASARLFAHYTAGAERGRDQETTSERISEMLAESSVSFLPRRLHGGDRDILPVYYVGQSPAGEIEEAVSTEGDPSMFFFGKDGAAVFLKQTHRSTSPWDTVQATFDDDGVDLPYLAGSLEIDAGDSFLFNDVRVTADGGLLQQATDSDSITAYQRRVLDLGETQMVSDGVALTEATTLLAKYKDPLPRITGFSLHGGQDVNHPGVLTQMLERELGDRVRIRANLTAFPGVDLDQTVFIRKISLSGSSSDPFLTAQWSLAQR